MAGVGLFEVGGRGFRAGVCAVKLQFCRGCRGVDYFRGAITIFFIACT